MLGSIMAALGFGARNEGGEITSNGRVFPRREYDKCVSTVEGKVMPVLDWSLGGVRVMGDPRPVNFGQTMDVVMKFQVRDQMVDVHTKGSVVRKMRDSFALQFEPLTGEIRQHLQQVIDDFNANDFAASQS